ncbi:hypothetical protein NX722_17860 [Endozoicomonas gorgoniicola]|uniref:Uncharacterized protein n=1 Tax=Endozoicomonas gorgoniicola TaxID=1234144 RepID=A0ABT3MYL4_9GAMM|nr:hypothetical protein [Endozoicomonas gorgoniicola]MCW7554454.1 hypothetical protein [Endozoicomonas gorgoniicola]
MNPIKPDDGIYNPFADPYELERKRNGADSESAKPSTSWWQSFSRSVKSIKMPELHLKRSARNAWKNLGSKTKSLKDFLIKPFKNLNLLRTTKGTKIKVAAIAGMIIGAPLGPLGMALGAGVMVGYAAHM